MTYLKCSIVIPAHQEGKEIITVLRRIKELVTVEFECIVVTDSLDDSTNSFINEFQLKDLRFRLVINQLAPGPANAIKYGIMQSVNDYLIVTMADGSDDPSDVDKLVKLLDRGVAIAAASRYMPGGQQVGAPFWKSTISRFAGLSLFYFRRVGTRDATNSFKGYRKSFIEFVGIDSVDGFEMGLELIAKAKCLKLPVAEIPTIWLEREHNISKFKLARWIPKYLKWYFVAFGLKSLTKSKKI